MVEPRRRCCVQAPDLAITDFDPTDRLSDLRNRLRPALHFFGETVPLGQNAFVLHPHAAVCFKRLQGVDPFSELRSSFVQAIPREVRILHLPTRDLHIVAREQWVQRARPGLLRCDICGAAAQTPTAYSLDLMNAERELQPRSMTRFKRSS